MGTCHISNPLEWGTSARYVVSDVRYLRSTIGGASSRWGESLQFRPGILSIQRGGAFAGAAEHDMFALLRSFKQ
jgi:hypothetical protein